MKDQDTHRSVPFSWHLCVLVVKLILPYTQSQTDLKLKYEEKETAGKDAVAD